MGMKKGQKQYGKAFIEEILKLREDGLTNRQIGVTLGVDKKVIKQAITRHNAWQRKIEQGIMPLPQGRPRKNSLSEEQHKDRRIKVLEMQVELLKKFREELRR